MASTTLQTGQKRLDNVVLSNNGDGQPVNLASMNLTILQGDVTLSFVDNAGNPLPANQVYIVAGGEGVSFVQYDIVAEDGRTTSDVIDITVTLAPQGLVVSHIFGDP